MIQLTVVLMFFHTNFFLAYVDDIVPAIEIPKLADIISIGDKLDSDRPIGERQSPDGQEEESDSNATVKTIGWWSYILDLKKC